MNAIVITLSLLFAAFATAPQAAKLFGVDLATATKTSLSQAAKNAGARLNRQAGELQLYDEYSSVNILEGSDKLFFGFSKETEKFAFAEYEFKGLHHEKMLQKLSSKYGEPEKIKQVFISDGIYRWQVDGIEISYYKDWQQYKTRVTYIVPELLAQLKVAQKKVKEAIVVGELNKQINVF